MCPTTTANFSRWNTLLTASIDILTIHLHQPHEALRHFKLSCFCIYSTFVILISHLPLLNFSIPNYQHVPLHSLIATSPLFHLGTNHKRQDNVSKSDFLRFSHISTSDIFQTMCPTTKPNLSQQTNSPSPSNDI